MPAGRLEPQSASLRQQGLPRVRTPSTAARIRKCTAQRARGVLGWFLAAAVWLCHVRHPGLGTILVAGLLVAWIVGFLEEVAVVGELSAGNRPLQHRDPEGRRHQVRGRAE